MMTLNTTSLLVATVLTACGIETCGIFFVTHEHVLRVATVLTACGIETEVKENKRKASVLVATVLTACGIETLHVLHETFLKC